jgi:hypothetical protein
VILAQAALVGLCSAAELQAIPIERVQPKAVCLSTVFNRGVTTVLLQLSACGFDIEKEKVHNLKRYSNTAHFLSNHLLQQTAICNVGFQCIHCPPHPIKFFFNAALGITAPLSFPPLPFWLTFIFCLFSCSYQNR